MSLLIDVGMYALSQLWYAYVVVPVGLYVMFACALACLAASSLCSYVSGGSETQLLIYTHIIPPAFLFNNIYIMQNM